jgi:hypothetical protein
MFDLFNTLYLMPETLNLGHLLSRPSNRPRRQRTTTLYPAGLNGTRAVARRLRQIASGSLRAENGLVSL